MKFPERSQLNQAIFPRIKTNFINSESFLKPRPKSYKEENRENQKIDVLADVANLA